MRRFYLVLVCLLVLGFLVIPNIGNAERTNRDTKNLVSPNLVISQFQTAGGSANDEFIEIHNTSSNPVDLNGYRVVYRSSSGTNDVNFAVWTTSVIVPAGGYYLITNSSYDGSVPGDLVYDPATCSCAMSATGGGLAIRFGAANSGVIIDSMGYGTATNAFIESAVTTAPPASSGQGRKMQACQDTDNNSSDFQVVTPSAPSNSSSTVNSCGGGGTTLLANGAASPSTVAPNATTLLTVAVFPATSPPSTGISVTGNLSNIGGSATQQFFDNGTNGDVTPGDNVFTYLATIPGNTPGGTTSVSAVASDAEERTVSVTINLTIDAPLAGEDPLVLGNPTNATTNIANENNYLMTKAQYSLSYNRSKAIPNWTAWRIASYLDWFDISSG